MTKDDTAQSAKHDTGNGIFGIFQLNATQSPSPRNILICQIVIYLTLVHHMFKSELTGPTQKSHVFLFFKLKNIWPSMMFSNVTKVLFNK